MSTVDEVANRAEVNLLSALAAEVNVRLARHREPAHRRMTALPCRPPRRSWSRI